jgi:hypothetical protein
VRQSESAQTNSAFDDVFENPAHSKNLPISQFESRTQEDTSTIERTVVLLRSAVTNLRAFSTVFTARSTRLFALAYGIRLFRGKYLLRSVRNAHFRR